MQDSVLKSMTIETMVKMASHLKPADLIKFQRMCHLINQYGHHQFIHELLYEAYNRKKMI